MEELTKILTMTDEGARKDALNTYELEKRACKGDSLGARCVACHRYGKPTCFDKNKAKSEGWKWH